MKTVILCGGKGTRLQEETGYRPKPMVEIGGRPILWHIMKSYQSHGFRDFVICTGHLGGRIKEYFHRYDAVTADFTYNSATGHVEVWNRPQDNFVATVADTGEDTMTGGRLAKVKKHVEDETFMMCYGDHLADVDISALVEFHKSHGRLATVTTAPHVSQFGIITTDNTGRATSFHEKPTLSGAISIGFFVLNPGVFGYLGGDECIFEQTPIQRLVEDGELMTFHHKGFHSPMDTYRDYDRLCGLWDSNNAPWKIWSS